MKMIWTVLEKIYYSQILKELLKNVLPFKTKTKMNTRPISHEIQERVIFKNSNALWLSLIFNV